MQLYHFPGPELHSAIYLFRRGRIWAICASKATS